MTAVRTCNPLLLVRLEAQNPNVAAHVPTPRGTKTKPSLIVRTESNVRREVKKKPDRPCVSCKGSGKVDCYICEGEGRTNCINSAMLPKGEWPRWCETCGGSGLKRCARCLGTGEYRRVIGFDFMYENGPQYHNIQHSRGSHAAADLLRNHPELLNPQSLFSKDEE